MARVIFLHSAGTSPLEPGQFLTSRANPSRGTCPNPWIANAITAAGRLVKDLFLCHTGDDKPWTEMLAERLERETVNGRPLEVFLDKWDIDYGENILQRIEEGLRQSRFLAVVLSPAFTRGDWPRSEWQTQVHSDPAGQLARILPLLRHKKDPNTGELIDIPLPLRLLRRFDFTTDSVFEPSFADLVRRRRGERPLRGRSDGPTLSGRGAVLSSAAPEEHEEVVLSNLLAVHRYPTALWSDETTATQKPEVWQAYKGSVPPFALLNGRLYSFHSPDDPASPFRRFLTGRTPQRERPADWLSDPDRARVLVGLCNSALKEHCYQLGIRTVKDEWPPRFYCPVIRDSRTFRWSKKARLRTLAKMAKKPNGESFGVHYAARMRFLTLGRDLFILVEPGWLFTSNGIAPLTGKIVTRLATQWGGRERNAAVLRNVLMWSVLLGQGKPEIAIDLGGGERLELKTVPAYAETRYGLPSDAIRLEQMLAGGGGEVLDPTSDLELDQVAALKIAGAIEEEEEEEAELKDEKEERDIAVQDAGPLGLDVKAPQHPHRPSKATKRGAK